MNRMVHGGVEKSPNSFLGANHLPTVPFVLNLLNVLLGSKERKTLGFCESYQPHYYHQPSTSLTTTKPQLKNTLLLFCTTFDLCYIFGA